MIDKKEKLGGRPKLGIADKKTYKITVKMNTQEYYHLKGLAMKCNQNISECVRKIIVTGYVKERISKEHLSIIRSLNGMANNLNQLARNANTHGITALEFQNKEAVQAIISTIDKLG